MANHCKRQGIAGWPDLESAKWWAVAVVEMEWRTTPTKVNIHGMIIATINGDKASTRNT